MPKKPFDKERHARISRKVDKLRNERGFVSMNALRVAAGIDPSNWSNMVNVKRPWSAEALQKVAAALGTTVDVLVDRHPPIPIVAAVSALESFEYKDKWSPAECIGFAANPFWEDPEDLKNLYAVKVKCPSDMDYPGGTIFYIQKHAKDFKTKDLVVYCDQKSRGHVRRLILNEDNFVLLPVSGAMAEVISLPRRHLENCDIVKHISQREFPLEK
jgi:hypothetical protein